MKFCFTFLNIKGRLNKPSIEPPFIQCFPTTGLEVCFEEMLVINLYYTQLKKQLLHLERTLCLLKILEALGQPP